MNYNFINYDAKVELCTLCIYDSNIGYNADFSVNGEVDFWDYYDGVHTYGCWNNFLFGTLYGEQALIGRQYNIMPIDGEEYYLVNISMLIKLVERGKDQALPFRAKFMWTTLEDVQWDEDKSMYVDIYPDSNWHSYVFDLSSKQKWVGNISNLRLYPIYEKGRDGDEFFIKTIQVRSNGSYACRQVGCSYYSQYSHPCGGGGERPCLTSTVILKDNFDISYGYNDTLILNINGYGDVSVSIDSVVGIKCGVLAKKITFAIGAVGVGGYSEAEMVFNALNTFVIYAGTYHSTSSIQIRYTKLAQELGFFDAFGLPIYTVKEGRTPANIYLPLSSFKMTPAQIVDLLDNSNRTYVEFNPSLYNVEGGRNDWYLNGLGPANIRVLANDTSSIFTRDFYLIPGIGKTLIDFSHPFNASGRVNKIYICGTADYGFEEVEAHGQLCLSGEWGEGRLFAKGIKIKIFRPRSDGTLEAVLEVPVQDREDPRTTLVSNRQEYTEVDCDIFVNRGDFIGIYNMDLYFGRSTNINMVDACYYTLFGDVALGGTIDPGPIHGEGNAGLLLYARSNQRQSCLRLSVDLNNRINVADIKIKGSVLDENIEYNIMRCLDFEWDVDLFGGSHETSFRHTLDFGRIYLYTCPNIAYGINRLNDGVYTIPQGKAADSFSVQEPTIGIVPVNPYYFWVNGDQEWLDVHYWPEFWKSDTHVDKYTKDPIAFTVIFPYGKAKMLHKFKTFFKEPYNFRSFALSTYGGPLFRSGDADDNRFVLIPEYTAVTLDGLKYSKDRTNYSFSDKYLFVNPSIGHAISKITGGPGLEWPGDAVIPGESTFSMNGVVLNNEQLEQAKCLDWKIIQHEWAPFSTYGFRFYCIYHESTKICEMELFGYLSGGIAKITAGTTILTSFYGEEWFLGTVYEDVDDSAVCDINNSIRYIDIELTPINTLAITDIEVNILNTSLYFGAKGCDDTLFLTDNTTKEVNAVERVDIKNVYTGSTNLFVDIARLSSGENRTLYYSDLNSEQAVVHPLVGPAGFYKKEDDYPFLNQNRNISINCGCYGLQNALIGARAYYSHNNGFSWHPFNEGHELTTDYINFLNLPDTSYSIVNIPILQQSKYWRFVLKGYDNTFNIREIMAYKGEELLTVQAYHDREATFNYTPATGRAPHLINRSVTGSYYKASRDKVITIELEDIGYIDKLVVYHDAVAQYTNISSINKFCGIDRYTLLYLDNTIDNIYDYSYYEHTNIYNHNVEIVYNEYTLTHSATYDFSNDVTSCFSWRGNNIYLHYTPPSGTLVGDNYEFPGYLNFNVYFLNTTTDPLYSANISTNDDIYYYTHELINPSFEIKVAMRLSWVNITKPQSGVTFGFLSGNYVHGGFTTNRFGPQVVTTPTAFKIIVQQWDNTNDVVSIPYSAVSGALYYYTFTSDGMGTYNLKIHTDGFDGNNEICSLQLYSIKQWENLYFGFSRADWLYDNTAGYAYGQVYYVSLQGVLLQSNNLRGEWPGSLSFNSSVNSYLTVPYEDCFNFSTKHFGIDFLIKFNKFPYGICNLVSESMDMHPTGVSFVDTGKYGYCGYLNGSAFITTPFNLDLDFSEEYFTIDFIFTFVNFINNATFFFKGSSYKFYYDVTARKFKFNGYQGGILSPNVSAEAYYDVLLNKPYHIAVSRTQEDMRFFIDGQIIGTPTNVSGSIDFLYATATTTDTNIYIGSSGSAFVEAAVGYIEEIRVTKGIARWTESFTVPGSRYEVDIYTVLLGRFNRDYVVLIENYDTSVGAPAQQKAWSIRLVQYKTYHVLQYIRNSSKYVFDVLSNNGTGYAKLKKNLWHHINISCGYYTTSDTVLLNTDINVDGKRRGFYTEITTSANIAPGYNNLVIGKYFDGNLKNLRISCSSTALASDTFGVRFPSSSFTAYTIPYMGYSRLYTVSIYNSINNDIYGLHSDIDLYKSSAYSYFNEANVFSSQYSSLFAIDLGNRYALDIVRSYGSLGVAPFTLTSNVLYSNIESEDPDQIRPLYLDSKDIFEEDNNTNKSINWVFESSSEGIVYIKDGLLFLKVMGEAPSFTSAKATSNYLLKDNFDFRFDYRVVQKPFYEWTLEIRLENFNKPGNIVKLERGEINGIYKYKLSILDDWYTVYTEVANSTSSALLQSLRVVRHGSFFIFYKKDIDATEWTEFFTYVVTTSYWEYTRVVFELKSFAPVYPEVELCLDNIEVYRGSVYYSTHKDARWVIVNMLNGDGVSRTLNKIGIYTDLQTHLAPSGKVKNNRWVSISNSITSYGGELNLAYTAKVTVSSQISSMSGDYLVDGNKDTSWGSGYDDPQPSFIVDIGTINNISMIRLFYGENSGDINYIVKNYTVSYSTDGTNYTPLVTIANNTSLERSHEANPYFTARYIKVYITSYSSKSVAIYDPETRRYRDFTGAVVREIEVYKYSGVVVSSESYPIIALDLNKHFYLATDHEVIGVDYENKESVDWDVGLDSFCYSNSITTNVNKVLFDAWGMLPTYEKWVVIKKDTATGYNSGPHYMRKIIIRSQVPEAPIGVHSWWSSYFSILSNSYEFLGLGHSLKLFYASSVLSDEVRFIEGDSFGVDPLCSWRDLFSFTLYIDNINNLDTTYGYIYFGGYDSTERHDPVVYKWNIGSIKDTLSTGINYIRLGFRYCDSLVYTNANNSFYNYIVEDSRDVKKINFGTIGIVFKGTGLGNLIMAIDNIRIERNHFDDLTLLNKGLYLTGSDYLTIPVSNIKMSSGSISFWIKTDFNLNGVDEYGVFKVRTIFSMINVSNDTFGLYVGSTGLVFYGGNINTDLNTFIITNKADSLGTEQLFHIGVSFSNTGTNLDSIGSTIHLYINNKLYFRSCTKWSSSDSKYFKLVFGGKNVFAASFTTIQKYSSMDAVISNLRICNYCRTDFGEDMEAMQDELRTVLYDSSDLIEISKDNVTFYKVGEIGLPLTYEGVPYLGTRPVYIRSNLKEEGALIRIEDRVAGLIIQWDVPIG